MPPNIGIDNNRLEDPNRGQHVDQGHYDRSPDGFLMALHPSHSVPCQFLLANDVHPAWGLDEHAPPHSCSINPAGFMSLVSHRILRQSATNDRRTNQELVGTNLAALATQLESSRSS